MKKILLLRINENCNADCFMCEFAKNKKNNTLSKDKFLNILQEINTYDFQLVRLTGGEPLLHVNIEDIIRQLKQSGYTTSVITNGFLLKQKCHEICSAGVDQVIISLDGNEPSLHDRLRNTEGLFNRIVSGLEYIQSAYPNVLIRINTVVSPSNYEKLTDMLNLLVELRIKQWSIIPLKTSDPVWAHVDRNHFLKVYSKFNEAVSCEDRIQLLGYSRQWAGRNIFEVDRYLKYQIPYTPNGACHLVQYVTLYDPFSGEITPCNCVIHRSSEVRRRMESDKNYGGEMSDWLCNNAADMCKGCEPINAYVSENTWILERDIFQF